MIKEEIHTNAIYQHYKGKYYKVIDVAYPHDEGAILVIYYQCDIHGIYQSIREEISIDHNDVTIITPQPFYRSITEFREMIHPKFGKQDLVPRFKFIKQL